MKIAEMFAKSIDRTIKGVVKVDQNDKDVIRQELEEYVVTHELQKHFASFFDAYCRSLNGHTDAMGVWISGFFGSGKSHFLKIISYLLDNRVIDGKKAIDYFIEDNKIQDNFVLGNMKRAAEAPADVILFNIDSKSKVNSHNERDAIVQVFLSVFNEKIGYCADNPFIADLERKLDSEGRLAEFKETFEDISMNPWDEARHDFDFIQDDIVDALVQMDYMSEPAARNWCEKASTQVYAITTEGFAKMVSDYIKSKGANHHVIFMVDEMGQYVGDNLNLLLNLQTVTEDLGTHCRGKAWVVVTSQQSISEVTKGEVKGDQFSKIQGRFDTRLSLSSANVDEVIRKRILEKNKTGSDTLTALYDGKSTVLKNLLLFGEGAEMKLYSGAGDFSQVYPFVPYQFNLLSNVLTSIRNNAAAGNSLADGERSMLALFKESAMKLGALSQGALVPFNLFYDALEQFVESSHRTVIIRAWNNEYLNPDKEEDCFTVNVLKTLFMIKYVKEIAPTLENITTLMTSKIDEDRIALQSKVEEALKRLVTQTLVQKNGNKYVFLTNEEQDINNAIKAQNVETAEVVKYVADLFFAGIYSDKKYFNPAFGNRYSFGFNQVVDDWTYKAQSNDMTLQLLTPKSEQSHDDASLRLLSGQSDCVLVVLPEKTDFWDEILAYKQIEKYFQTEAGNSAVKYKQIEIAKRSEMNEHIKNARLSLEDALRSAVIYINGSVVTTASKDIRTRITEALGKLADRVYSKLSYIDAPFGEADIRSVLTVGGNTQIKLGEVEGTPNQLALNDMADYIENNSSAYNKLSLKTIMTRFQGRPYGFTETDVSWLLAKLLRNGDISWTVNSEPVSLATKSADELTRFVTKKDYLDKLMISKRDKVSDKQKKITKQVMQELFKTTAASDDEDIIMSSFISKADTLKVEMEGCLDKYSKNPEYPGKSVVSDGRKLLIDLCAIKYAQSFFTEVEEHEDDLKDLAEDYEAVVNFFKGKQREIFDLTVQYLATYEDSKSYIVNKELEAAVASMRAIVKKPNPYGDIPKLPAINEAFKTAYSAILDENLVGVAAVIEEKRADAVGFLTGKRCYDEFSGRLATAFTELKNKAESCTNLATLMGCQVEADAVCTRFINDVEKRENALIEEEKKKGGKGSADPGPAVPKPPVKKGRTVHARGYIGTNRFENDADIDAYLATLGEKLKKELSGNDYIDFTF